MQRNKSSIQFMQAQMSSLIATTTDFLVTALLFRIAGWNHVLATFIGSVCGGVTNCTMNYRWAFRGSERTKRAIALRYAAVWGGSILLNTWGVALLMWLIAPRFSYSLETLISSKVIVALVVAITWNFLLQKRWVFR